MEKVRLARESCRKIGILKALPIYHADRVVSETGKYLRDGTHIVYVNGAYRGNNPIGKIMHDLSCENLSEMFYRKLAGQVKYYNEDEKEVAVMSKIVEDLIDMEKKEIALKMVKDGKLQEENVITYFGFSLEQNEEHQKAKTV